MKGFSCVLLIVATAQLGQVSSFVAPSLTPAAALQLPLAARRRHHVHSSDGSRRASIWVQSLSAEVDHGSHSKETTVARSISVRHRLADLARAVVVQAAVLVSFFVLSPVITLATAGWQASEEPAPSARSSQPKRLVWLATVLPMDALGEARAAHAAAQEKARLSSELEIEDLSILEQAKDLSELGDLSILEQAKDLSTERKNWLHSPQARKMGMLLVSAASLTMNLNTADSALVAKAQEQVQQPLDQAKTTSSHDTAAGLHTRTHTHTQTFTHTFKLRQLYFTNRERTTERERASERERERERERETYTRTHTHRKKIS